MMLLSVQAFCGPAMADAITGEADRRFHRFEINSSSIPGLGGGGLATPQVSNITNAITYAMLATCMFIARSGLLAWSPLIRQWHHLVCFFGGPIVNKIGVKWALVIGAATFPIEGSAYYCNSKYGNQWVSPIHQRFNTPT
jgi:hypothetical protein